MQLKYRRKPIVVEAFQMTRKRRVQSDSWPVWLHQAWKKERKSPGSLYPTRPWGIVGTLSIGAQEGQYLVSFGDWIIQGALGEIYSCRPEVFEATYEAVGDVQRRARMNKYILDGKTPVLEPDLFKWANWHETGTRSVSVTTAMPGKVVVSTVFLGIDHAHEVGEAPELFETLVFGGPLDGNCARCATWEEAEKQHEVMAELARLAAAKDD